MSKVDFCTYCCEKDREKLQEHFESHVNSHHYNFDNKYVIHQRCDFIKVNAERVRINEGDYEEILSNQGINPDNEQADKYTHGWTGPHYWKHHTVNHLMALHSSTANYIVLSDSDCYIKTQPVNQSWIKKGIDKLKSDKSILVVSPSDGGQERKTQTMSQQLFLCDRNRLLDIDFDLPFEGFKDGGPFQEYYFMLEGRIGRYMEKHNLFRYILDQRYRYWHSQWIVLIGLFIAL